MKKAKKENVEVSTVLTLSKYHFGQHHFDEKAEGDPSFQESLSPICYMIQKLYEKGVPLRSKVKITMKGEK